MRRIEGFRHHEVPPRRRVQNLQRLRSASLSCLLVVETDETSEFGRTNGGLDLAQASANWACSKAEAKRCFVVSHTQLTRQDKHDSNARKAYWTELLALFRSFPRPPLAELEKAGLTICQECLSNLQRRKERSAKAQAAQSDRAHNGDKRNSASVVSAATTWQSDEIRRLHRRGSPCECLQSATFSGGIKDRSTADTARKFVSKVALLLSASLASAQPLGESTIRARLAALTSPREGAFRELLRQAMRCGVSSSELTAIGKSSPWVTEKFEEWLQELAIGSDFAATFVVHQPAPFIGPVEREHSPLGKISRGDYFLLGLVSPSLPVPGPINERINPLVWQRMMPGMYGPTSGYDGETARLRELTREHVYWEQARGIVDHLPAIYSWSPLEQRAVPMSLVAGKGSAYLCRLHLYVDGSNDRIRFIAWIRGRLDDPELYLRWLSLRDQPEARLINGTLLRSWWIDHYHALADGRPPVHMQAPLADRPWEWEQPRVLQLVLAHRLEGARLLPRPIVSLPPPMPFFSHPVPPLWRKLIAHSPDVDPGYPFALREWWEPQWATFHALSDEGLLTIASANYKFNRDRKPMLFSGAIAFRWMMARQLAMRGHHDQAQHMLRLDKMSRRRVFDEAFQARWG
jgi:hypothetical protein